MKAVLCKAYGPPDSLVVEDVPRIDEAYGQVDLPLLQISVVHANFVSSVAV
jgi:hypothetical protein